MSQEIEKVQEIMKTAQGNSLDVYYSLLTDYLLKSDDPESLFAVILSTPRMPFSEDPGPSNFIGEAIREEVIEKYAQLLNDTVERQAEDNPNQDDFYKNLYYIVFRSKVFPDDIHTQTVLLYLLSEETVLIPYYQAVNLLIMENDEFHDNIRRLFPQFQQAAHMLNRRFKSRTEEASQLWEISQQLKSEQEQIVYWAVLISMIRTSVIKSIKGDV